MSNTNVGNDGAIIAKSALDLAFATLEIMATKGLLTADDMGRLHAAAFPAAASSHRDNVDALTAHIKSALAEVQARRTHVPD